MRDTSHPFSEGCQTCGCWRQDPVHSTTGTTHIDFNYNNNKCVFAYHRSKHARILYVHPRASFVINRDRSDSLQIGLYRSDEQSGPRGMISSTIVSATVCAEYIDQFSVWENVKNWLGIERFTSGYLKLGPVVLHWE